MMNERIRELFLQAGFHTPVMKRMGDEYKFEKFAALIVRECAEICKKQEYDYWRSSEDQDFTPQDCADAIEQHFGVEEQTIEQDQIPLPTNREQAMAMLRVATFYLDTQK